MADYIRTLRITPSGHISDVPLPTRDRQLDAMHGLIGCDMVQPVDLGNGVTMWADEDGFAVDRPTVNLMATGIAARHGLTHQPYVGNILFTGGMDEHGESLGLTVDQSAELRAIAESVVRSVIAYRMSHPADSAMQETAAVQTEFAAVSGLAR